MKPRRSGIGARVTNLRGGVSQVRILPGPLFFLCLLALTRPYSFQALSEAWKYIRTANLHRASYD
jgi:hypothetical protein